MLGEILIYLDGSITLYMCTFQHLDIPVKLKMSMHSGF